MPYIHNPEHHSNRDTKVYGIHDMEPFNLEQSHILAVNVTHTHFAVGSSQYHCNPRRRRLPVVSYHQRLVSSPPLLLLQAVSPTTKGRVGFSHKQTSHT